MFRIAECIMQTTVTRDGPNYGALLAELAVDSNADGSSLSIIDTILEKILLSCCLRRRTLLQS